GLLGIGRLRIVGRGIGDQYERGQNDRQHPAIHGSAPEGSLMLVYAHHDGVRREWNASPIWRPVPTAVPTILGGMVVSGSQAQPYERPCSSGCARLTSTPRIVGISVVRVFADRGTCEWERRTDCERPLVRSPESEGCSDGPVRGASIRECDSAAFLIGSRVW